MDDVPYRNTYGKYDVPNWNTYRKYIAILQLKKSTRTRTGHLWKYTAILKLKKSTRTRTGHLEKYIAILQPNPKIQCIRHCKI